MSRRVAVAFLRSIALTVTLSVVAPYGAVADDPSAPNRPPAASAPQPAQRLNVTAGTIEDGLNVLAQDIVARSTEAGRRRIGVLPFPDGNGACSALSTYVAEELFNALFSFAGTSLELIERTQVEGIYSEIQAYNNHQLDPGTTPKLSVSGVQAIVVGTITEIGERVRINARLIAVDTGHVVSAAGVTIPKTTDIGVLLRQPAPNASGTCRVRAARPETLGSAATPPSAGAGQSFASGTFEEIAFSVESITREGDGKFVSLVLEAVNKAAAPIRLAIAGPPPILLETGASSAVLKEWNGVARCPNWWTPRQCRDSFNRFDWTMLNPGFPLKVVLRFNTESLAATGTSVSLQGVFLKGPAEKMSRDSIREIALSFSNLPLAAAP